MRSSRIWVELKKRFDTTVFLYSEKGGDFYDGKKDYLHGQRFKTRPYYADVGRGNGEAGNCYGRGRNRSNTGNNGKEKIMLEIPYKKSIERMKAKILTTKKCGGIEKTIRNGKFSYDELVNLYVELPDKKVRRWYRNRRTDKNMQTIAETDNLPLIY